MSASKSRNTIYLFLVASGMRSQRQRHTGLADTAGNTAGNRVAGALRGDT